MYERKSQKSIEKQRGKTFTRHSRCNYSVITKGIFYYNYNVARTEIYREASPNGKYTVVVTQIGRPIWREAPNFEYALYYSKYIGSNNVLIFNKGRTYPYYETLEVPNSICWITEGLQIVNPLKEVSDEEPILETLLYEDLS